jgi:hypothetical protein
MGERVNYLCQRCQQPLRLDPSLLSLDEHTLAELSLPITPTPNHHQLVSQVFIYPSRPLVLHMYLLVVGTRDPTVCTVCTVRFGLSA